MNILNRVEDMMKRSFAETDSTKHEVDRRQALTDLKKKISDLEKNELCPVCEVDIDEYYSACARLTSLGSQMKVLSLVILKSESFMHFKLETTSSFGHQRCYKALYNNCIFLQAIFFSSPHTWKALSAGRVVTVCCPRYGYSLAVALQLSSSAKQERTFSLLMLCESDIDDEVSTRLLFPADSLDSVGHYKTFNEVYSPSGVLSHTVVEVPVSVLVNITATVLKIEAKAILEEFKRRLIPRFRYMYNQSL